MRSSINPANENIKNLAVELSSIVDQYISSRNIISAVKNRGYYIQIPKVGAPILLNSKGFFGVDLNPDDYEKISSGKISPTDYIASAKWQVGYYSGRGTMIDGGYYQPFDIVGRQKEAREYLKIIFCLQQEYCIGYIISRKTCNRCLVKDCPISYFRGTDKTTLEEYDPRIDLLSELKQKFEDEYAGNIINEIYCDKIRRDEAILIPYEYFYVNKDFGFDVVVSEEIIQDLLMRELVIEEYINNFHFMIYDGNQLCNLTPEIMDELSIEKILSKRKKEHSWTNRIRKFFKN